MDSREMNRIHELVKEKGFPVFIDTEYCKQYLATHENKCTGCESNVGCTKSARIGALLTQRIFYQPTSFADDIEADKVLYQEIDRILSTKETHEPTV